MAGTLIGHSISDGTGRLIAMDVATSDYLHRSQRDIIGLNYLDLTHPDDVMANVMRVHSLDAGSRPIIIRKRYIRPGAAPVITDVTISRISFANGEEQLIGTLFSVSDSDSLTNVKTLRAAALENVGDIQKRVETFGTSLIGEPGWHALLEIYLAEADGRLIGRVELAALIGQPRTLTRMLVDAFVGARLLEAAPDRACPLQLTVLGFSQVERLLAARINSKTVLSPAS